MPADSLRFRGLEMYNPLRNNHTGELIVEAAFSGTGVKLLVEDVFIAEQVGNFHRPFLGYFSGVHLEADRQVGAEVILVLF